MRTTLGSPHLNIVMDPAQGDGPLSVWRIVRTDVADDPVFVGSLRSNYELGQPPRRVEKSAAIIHMGISTFLSQSQAIGTAQRFEKLGGYVARLDLHSGHGFNYAHTGMRGHITVWETLLSCRMQLSISFLSERGYRMQFAIFDSSANLVESYDQMNEGKAALEEIVRLDPESASEYALITYDDAGCPVGNAVVGSDLGILA